MNWLALLPLLIQALPDIQSAFNTSTSNSTLGQKLSQLAAPISDLLTNIGSQLFPKASPTLHAIGGAIAAFNPDYTKWLQGALNNLGYASPPLVVDGLYGAKTTAAVEAAQKALGITIDGLAGNITEGLLAAALAKLPQVK